ncbi:hypothetical protein NP233_g11515 [Leucocoprinus birnbaumii]|uniref:Protein kinase domain-containing protein n=1 Tax=Leucocoprinus birnbaumii TaxID=56174 RepID=A0AAD5YL80_9AGAR|nr:hypothetical protein NP233_g11515 [Leucocoprinus birnbaumii]
MTIGLPSTDQERQANSIASASALPLSPSQGTELPLSISKLFIQLKSVMSDSQTFHLLLKSSPDELQFVVDWLQCLLLHPSMSENMWSQALKVLIRLSTQSSLYPKTFDLQGGEPTGRSLVDEAPSCYADIEHGFIARRAVCLKVLQKSRKGKPGWKSFIREIVIQGQLKHNNIHPFFGVQHLDDGKFCLISPWAEKGCLVKYLRTHPDANRLLLLRDVVSGLEYIHTKSIIHGDLKPTNILVTLSGRACLADFGLGTVAGILGVELSRYPMLETTGYNGPNSFRFDAPELLLNETTSTAVHRTTASDMYSAGCMFYEVLTEKPPLYEAETPSSLIVQVHGGARPTKPTGADLSRCISKGMTEAVWVNMEACWDRDVEKRPTATEMLSLPFFTTLEDRRPPDPPINPPKRLEVDCSDGSACQQRVKILLDSVLATW